MLHTILLVILVLAVVADATASVGRWWLDAKRSRRYALRREEIRLLESLMDKERKGEL